MIDIAHIRNFSIVAHIDHGKSTLSDRLIQICGGLTAREMQEKQVLDSMDLERERGITIKAQTCRLRYRSLDGNTYILNLIDTPGHVDFSYEVSRSLAACEGALLVVDASQGVEAQTLANIYLAFEANLTLFPVLNKIDLPAAMPREVKQQIEDVVGIDVKNALSISAKTGLGIQDVLEAIVTNFPCPKGDRNQELQALLIDSWYDSYLGVIILLRIKNGSIQRGDKIRMMSSGSRHVIEKVGILTPKGVTVEVLHAGEIGFVTASIKSVKDCQIGDTVTHDRAPCKDILPGFAPSTPVVFCGMFPTDQGQFKSLKDGLEKLSLNDSSFHFEQEGSTALGLGFRCGFLGLLHLEIIQERLHREFDLDLITTAPSVIYLFKMKDGSKISLHNPNDFPNVSNISSIQEPWIKATLMMPEKYLGAALTLCSEKRGKQLGLTYMGNRVVATYSLPLNEVVFDFYDRLKSVSKGYASFDYEHYGYEDGDLVHVRILVNGESVDSLSMIIHRDQAEHRGRNMCEKLKVLIPRHLFKIPIQAAIGGRIIARTTISAIRKDVTAKCYGGDVSRKRKLLDKQKKGKQRMRQFGDVQIPQSAFLKALKMHEN